MKKILYFFPALLIFIVFSAFINSDELINKIVSNLEQFRQDFPQEKVYLHTDRHFYAAGETLWFKAYLSAGISDQLSPLSKTLYVQLIDAGQQIVAEKKLYINEGLSYGEIELPGFLDNGSYVLRAYTHWMRNFPEAYFFYKKIQIQSATQPEIITQIENNDIDLQFFPEGGDLLKGIRSKVAFKAIGTDGLGKQVKGVLYNNKSEKIADIQSLQFGMGSFFLLPAEDESYYVILEDYPDKKYNLSKPLDHGIVMTVTNQEEQEDVVVRLQAKLPADQAEVVLIANSRSYPAYIAKVNLSPGLAFVRIPKNNLLQGITQLSILDKDGKPLNERLIFLDGARKLNIAASTNKAVFSNREKTSVNLAVTDAEGKPVKAFLSLSAIDRNEVKEEDANANIVQYLQFSSELKGYIENPGYYFNENNADRLEALDNLLLTQGWSRFNWQEITTGNFEQPEYYIERGLNILGKLIDDVSKKPIDNGKVSYFNKDGDAAFAKTGKNGMFILNDLVFFDTTEVVLQGTNSKGKKWVKFELEPDVAAPAGAGIFNDIIFESDFDEVFARRSMERRNIEAAYNFDPDAQILDEVRIRAQRIEESQERKIYQGASRSIKTADIPGAEYALHPLMIIQGRMAGVRILPNPPGYTIEIRGQGSISSGTTPLILLDNMPVDISLLDAIPAYEIESIDLFTGAEAAIFGVQGANGVLAFYTKRGGNFSTQQAGIINIRRSGYALGREFYKPKYDVRLPEHVKPDRRVTLHWEPMIETDENGKARVEFFNHDNEAEIEILVEGMTASGIPGVGRHTYTVKK